MNDEQDDFGRYGLQRRPEIKPQFIYWTDWILDGDAVTYSTAGYGSAESPSACRWLVPNTGHNRT